MKTSMIFFLLTLTSLAFGEVYTDLTIRPCDPAIAASWEYTPTPVHAPGTPKMPFHCEGDVKVFEITAEEVMSVFDESYEPGPVYTWGYNGSNPGPVIEILEGEKIKVIFKNKLPEPSSIHWHGIHLPYNQDGVTGHSQNAVKPGDTFVYEWSANQSGTYMYHAHNNSAKQLSMGLVGFLIIHPKKTPETIVDHDFLYFFQMWALPPHSIYPDVMEMMMFNYFTMNGKSAPYIPAVTVYKGQKVRIRFANMSMMEHPAHLHGLSWRVVATGSGDNPRSSHTYGNTVLVGTAQTIDVIVDEINNPGEWMLHCHLPHHVTNNMDIDIIPGEPMYMADGGMHTQLIVHRGPNDPGYVNASGEDGQSGGSHGGSHGGGHGDMPAPQITTYDGHIKLSNGVRLDATLELFKAQEDKEWRKLKAFLKVYLNKEEFLTYEYDQIKYNFETGHMSLENENKSVTLSNLEYMDHDGIGMLSGEASVDFGTQRGEIRLETRDPEMNNIRLKNNSSITGEYSGTCSQRQTFLQILTARDFKNEDINNNNPLLNFNISGSIGSLAANQKQVDGFVKEAFYDPFKGELNLKIDYAGVMKPLSCKTIRQSNKITGLDCGECKLKIISNLDRESKNDDSPLPFFIKDNTPKLSEMSESKEIAGDYFGALKLSANNKIVPMDMKIVAKRYALNSMVITKNHISGVAEFHIGKEKLSFKLKERQFLDSSSVVNEGRNLLLLESTGKLSIVINSWSKNSVSGVAYHESYGTLGNFSVRKKASTLPFQEKILNSQFIPLPDGLYSGDGWELQLSSTNYEDGNSSNLYSPLHLKGTLRKNNNGPLLSIVNGTYDIINSIAHLETDDGRILKMFLNHNEAEIVIPSKPLRRSKYLSLTESKIILKRVKK